MQALGRTAHQTFPLISRSTLVSTLDFSQKLQHWYASNACKMPWRGTKDAYHIWLSEVILQQTRIDQGWAYYERFIRLFPTVTHLAKASERDVLNAWQGLGYYSRARNLHKAAKLIASQGTFPNTYNSLLLLPGIGDYTASAIASFAFDLPHAVVDGNVYRVLSRYFDIDTAIDTTEGKRTFKETATAVLDPKHSAIHNQAIMDLGRMVCTPRSPKCQECPLHDGCAMPALHKNPEDLPRKRPKVSIKVRYFNYVFVNAAGKLLLHRRGDNDIWKGLYEPLLIETSKPTDAALLLQQMAKQLRINPQVSTFKQIAANVRHQLTHQLIIADAFLLTTNEPLSPSPETYISISLSDFHTYPVPRLIERLWAKVNI